MEQIRTATAADAARLAEIYAYYVKNTAVTFEYEPPSAAEFKRRIAATEQWYPYLVIEREGRVEGYAYAGRLSARAAYDWSCEVSVYVDRAARGGGLGRRLYEALESALAEMGVVNLYACVACPEGDDPYLTADSVAFHGRMGYRQVGAFHHCGCKFGRWYSVLWMEKAIALHRPHPQPVRQFVAGEPTER